MEIINLTTKTTPKVFHAPGCKNSDYAMINPFWETLQKIIFVNQMGGQCQFAKDVTIVTWSTSQDLTILERSLNNLNLTPLVLRSPRVSWSNNKKIPLLLEVFSNIKTKFVLGLDSLDVVILDYPFKKLIDLIDKLNREMVFGGETTFWPYCENNCDLTRFRNLECSDCKYTYLNGGMWFGKRDFCEFFFKTAMDSNPNTCDTCSSNTAIMQSEQRNLHSAFVKNMHHVTVDGNSEVFQNINHHTWRDFYCYKCFI